MESFVQWRFQQLSRLPIPRGPPVCKPVEMAAQSPLSMLASLRNALQALQRAEWLWPTMPSSSKARDGNGDASPHWAQMQGWKLVSWGSLPGRPFSCCQVNVYGNPLTIWILKIQIGKERKIKIAIILPAWDNTIGIMVLYHFRLLNMYLCF